MKCGITEANIDIKSWEGFPRLRGRGNHYTAQCPSAGGDDRLQIELVQRGVHEPQVWCRTCLAREAFDEKVAGERKKYEEVKREPEIDPVIIDQMHSNMNGHRAYYKSRGISDKVIDLAKLGWSEKYQRYAIPCFIEAKPYGIQYRIEPGREARLKAAGEEYKKYFSEKGGVNHVLFGQWIAARKPPYLFVDESPLDALMLTSLGYPCVAPFSGNNKWKAWDTAWNVYLKGIPEIVIIRQNDEPSQLITLARLNDIGRGRIIGAPSGFKDFGEFATAKGAQETARIMQQISGLPAVRSLI